jgi:hypothetical protein
MQDCFSNSSLYPARYFGIQKTVQMSYDVNMTFKLERIYPCNDMF